MAGTAIYNVWRMFLTHCSCDVKSNIPAEQIEKKFKWYKRLHALLSSSPVHDRTGLVNSASPIDLDILTQQGPVNDEPQTDSTNLNKERDDHVSCNFDIFSVLN